MERHYNYTSPAYHPERRVRDSSRAKPGVVDSYEMKAPARVPQASPERPSPTDDLKEDPSTAPEPVLNKTDATNSTIPAPLTPNSTEAENLPTHDPSTFMSGEKIVPVQIPSATPPPAPSPSSSTKSFFELHRLSILIASGSCLLLLFLCCCCRHRSRKSPPILPGPSTSIKQQ